MSTTNLPPTSLSQPCPAEVHRARGLAAMRVCGRLADAGIDLETFLDASLSKLIAAETEHVLAGAPSPTPPAAGPKSQTPAPAAARISAPAATPAPGWTPGIFRAPAGSKIHPDGKVRTPNGDTFTPCSISGVALHMSKPEPYPAPDWILCKPYP